VFEFGPLTVSLRVIGDRFRERLTTAIGSPRAGADRKATVPDPRHRQSRREIAPPPDWRFRAAGQHQFRLHERATSD